jgi:hypothetical protein
MSISNPDKPSPDAQEQRFILQALASVEKAERYGRVRQIVVTVLAFTAAFWLAFRAPSSEMNVECTILIFVGLMLAVCTAKIKSLINRNTRTILQAIADLQQN